MFNQEPSVLTVKHSPQCQVHIQHHLGFHLNTGHDFTIASYITSRQGYILRNESFLSLCEHCQVCSVELRQGSPQRTKAEDIAVPQSQPLVERPFCIAVLSIGLGLSELVSEENFFCDFHSPHCCSPRKYIFSDSGRGDLQLTYF